MDSDNKRYLIVDGSNYLFRSYFGVPEFAIFNGVKVNAVYGFSAILRRVTRTINPDTIIVVFDSQTGIVNKIEERPEYKATRELVDTGMYVQLPMIKKILERCGMQWIEPPDHEADDIIGSLAYKVTRNNGTAFISSNDFDFAQLITDKVVLVRDIRGNAIHITESDFLKEWGFKPIQYLDYLALKGDSSDNVMGIRGIGPKIAKSLVIKYDSIQGIIDHLEELAPNIANKLRPETNRILSNLKFLKIQTNISDNLDNIVEKRVEFSQKALYDTKTNEHLTELGIGLDENITQN